MTFGGGTATILSSTATSVTVTVPNSAVTGPIAVTTAGGTATSSDPFPVLPKATSFTPTRGRVGTLVKIKGGGLMDATGVYFGSGTAVTITHVSPTELDAVVPFGASSDSIEVLGVGFDMATTAEFTVT